MIEPLHLIYGGSLEGEVAAWVEDIQVCGWIEDHDGSDRVGLGAAIAEDLPTIDLPSGRRWDPEEWIIHLFLADGRPLAYHFFGPSAWKRLMAAGAESN